MLNYHQAAEFAAVKSQIAQSMNQGAAYAYISAAVLAVWQEVKPLTPQWPQPGEENLI